MNKKAEKKELKEAPKQRTIDEAITGTRAALTNVLNNSGLPLSLMELVAENLYLSVKESRRLQEERKAEHGKPSETDKE